MRIYKAKFLAKRAPIDYNYYIFGKAYLTMDIVARILFKVW